MKTLLIGIFVGLIGALSSWVGYAEEAGPKSQIVAGSLLPSEGVASPSGVQLTAPFGIDFDATGNMYVVELSGGRVFQRDVKKKWKQIAGDGSQGYLGDGGLAEKATFDGMHNVAVTPNGDVFIADSWNHVVRKIDHKTKIISTIAGTGKAGFSGDNGPATKAAFDYMMCITLNALNDKLFVADLRNRRIRVIDLKSGMVQTVAGNGEKGIPKDGQVATESPLIDPRAVAPDSKGNVYILERGGHALRCVYPNGTIRTVAGRGEKGDRDGPALQAQFGSPKHLCVDEHDNVYIADDQNGLIRKYDRQTKLVSTVLGRGKGKPPITLKNPHGVCMEKGVLYVVDTGNNRILRVEI